MQPTQPVEFNLPQDLIASLNEAVASGQYYAPDEIVLIALEEWRLRQQILRERLRALVEEGIASGRAEPFTLEELLAEARRRRSSK